LRKVVGDGGKVGRMTTSIDVVQTESGEEEEEEEPSIDEARRIN
jgi:hypothetical protein